MAKYEVKDIDSKKIWEDFLLSKNPQSFLQSWNWGEVNEATGEKILRKGIYKDNKLVGIFLAIKQNARRGPHILIPAGPIVDWSDKRLMTFFISELKKIAIGEKVWFVRIRPELLDTDSNKQLFSSSGLVNSPMHLNAENSWLLDITKNEEDLLSEMRKTTRYLIKRSLKENLILIKSKDPKTASILFDLQKETAERHGFVGFSKKLFENEIKTFAGDDMAINFVCKEGNKTLASAIIIFYGDKAYYHFSGSTSMRTQTPFMYYLLWQAILEAKKRGKEIFDFWGIAPDNNPKHRFAGVTLFKTGFGGYRVDWLHAHDLVISPLYYFTYLFELLRKVTRRL